MLAKNVDLLFFDETSFNSWMIKEKIWQRSDDLLELELNRKYSNDSDSRTAVSVAYPKFPHS